MTNPTIWHNRRWSKSRQVLQLLRDKGFDPVVIDYIKASPTKSEIAEAINLLGIEPIALMRTGEKLFKETGRCARRSDPCNGKASHFNRTARGIL